MALLGMFYSKAAVLYLYPKWVSCDGIESIKEPRKLAHS